MKKFICSILSCLMIFSVLFLVGCDDEKNVDALTADLRLTANQKNEYLVGDSMENYRVRYYANVDDIINFEDLTTNSAGVSVSGFSTSSAGTKTLTISYKGKSVSLTYNVYEVPTTIDVDDGEYYFAKNTVLTFNSSAKTVTVTKYNGYIAYQNGEYLDQKVYNYTLTIKNEKVCASWNDGTNNHMLYKEDDSVTYKLGSVDRYIYKINITDVSFVEAGHYIERYAFNNSLFYYELDEYGERIKDTDDNYVKIRFDVHLAIASDNTLSLYTIDEFSNRRDFLVDCPFDYCFTNTSTYVQIENENINVTFELNQNGTIKLSKQDSANQANDGFTTILVKDV